jgi:hypothetical protein
MRGAGDEYAVSDLGRVANVRTGRILRPGRTSSGHLTVVPGRQRGSRYVHVLVMETFVGVVPENYEVRHLDGDPGNNRLSNLAYGTRGDNMRDVKHHGGRSNYKLSPDDVRSIKDMLGRHKGRDLAWLFGVTEQVITAMKHGRIHTDV